VEIINSSGEKELKKIEVEAFAQSTEKPNGIINPGAEKTKYNVIKNSLSGDNKDNFKILDREGQIELYFKSLAEEIKSFNLESTLEEIEKQGEEYYEKDKSKKFAFRLANLFELNNNNTKEVLMKARRISGDDTEKVNLLKTFIKISKEFSGQQEVRKEGVGLTELFDQGSLQESVKNLQERIEGERKSLISSYSKIESKVKNKESLSEQDKEDLRSSILAEVSARESLIDDFLNYNKNINRSNDSYKDLPLYTFTTIFRDNYIDPFCKKMKKMYEEL
jgi:hypothetical protein